MEVVTEIKLPNGIGMMNAEWKEKHAAVGESKEAFFLEFLSGNIETWNKWIPSGQSIPIVISGMASSTIGIRSLEYAPIPFPVSGQTAITQWIPAAGPLKHPVLLISGVKTDDDVMRGEETQLIGLLEIIQIDTSNRHLFILPGTHSKHRLNNIELFHHCLYDAFMHAAMKVDADADLITNCRANFVYTCGNFTDLLWCVNPFHF